MFVFNVPPTAEVTGHLETGSRLSLNRQTGEAGDRTLDPCVQGERIIHNTMAAPLHIYVNLQNPINVTYLSF